MGAGGERLGEVAGELDAAVGDDRHAVRRGGARAVEDGGDLRHAGAGDHAGGADAAGPMPTFSRSMPGDVLGGVATLPTTKPPPGNARAASPRLEHAAAVGVRGVEHQDVDLGADQGRGTLEVVPRRAHRRANTRAAELVLAGVRGCCPSSGCP